MLKIRPFNASYIGDAAALFSATFDEARQALPLIPPRPDLVPFTEIEIIAAFADDKIVAYFVLRKGTAETEFFRNPSNGQIKGAYGDWRR